MYLIPFQAGKQISKTASACWGTEHAAVGILFSYLHRCSLVFLRPSMQLKIYTGTSQHLLYRSEEEHLCRGLGVLKTQPRLRTCCSRYHFFKTSSSSLNPSPPLSKQMFLKITPTKHPGKQLGTHCSPSAMQRLSCSAHRGNVHH